MLAVVIAAEVRMSSTGVGSVLNCGSSLTRVGSVGISSKGSTGVGPSPLLTSGLGDASGCTSPLVDRSSPGKISANISSREMFTLPVIVMSGKRYLLNSSWCFCSPSPSPTSVGGYGVELSGVNELSSADELGKKGNGCK